MFRPIGINYFEHHVNANMIILQDLQFISNSYTQSIIYEVLQSIHYYNIYFV